MSDPKSKGDEKNLSGDHAVDKLKDLAEEKICLFCTTEDGKLVSRPMSTQKVDADGNLWFLSSKGSPKNAQIKKDDTVYLMYADTSKQHYLSLSGTAEIVKDRSMIHELWNPIAKAWFEGGEDDPDISIIKVTPDEGHYWDTKNGKLISLLKIAVAAVTGKGSDGGVEGNIKV